jgi:hypothetical protein
MSFCGAGLSGLQSGFCPANLAIKPAVIQHSRRYRRPHLRRRTPDLMNPRPDRSGRRMLRQQKRSQLDRLYHRVIDDLDKLMMRSVSKLPDEMRNENKIPVTPRITV